MGKAGHKGRAGRRRRGWIAFAAVGALVAALGLHATTPPDCAAGCRLADGLDLTVEETPEGGRLWLLELDYTRPDLAFGVRRFQRRPDGTHVYRLIPLDLAAARRPAIAAVNLTLYHPAEWWRSHPGRAVQSVETVIVDGDPSHRHAHSYLWYWDSDRRLHVSLDKPPSADALAAAVLGFGVQGHILVDGRLGGGSDALDTLRRNTVVGADPEAGRFWIAVASRSTQRWIAARLADAGARVAAPVDSGSSSSLVLGPGAPPGLVFKGTRGWRPLGAIFYVAPAGG